MGRPTLIQVKFAEINYSQFDRRHVRSAMGRGARAMAARMREQVRGSGTGEVYGRHTASAPGQPPARYTGRLMRTIRGRASRRGYALVVSTVAPHAALLELGTRHMEPRPAWEPTFADRDLVVGLLRGAYAAAITATPGQVGRPPRSVEIN
jgi:hypothetical protein